MRQLFYATVDHPIHGPLWLCAYNDETRSFTGMGVTPNDAYENLQAIATAMFTTWTDPQLH